MYHTDSSQTGTESLFLPSLPQLSLTLSVSSWESFSEGFLAPSGDQDAELFPGAGIRQTQRYVPGKLNATGGHSSNKSDAGVHCPMGFVVCLSFLFLLLIFAHFNF